MYNDRITAVKNRLGSDLAILAHHYQSDSIVEHADLVGDSLQLAAAIPELDARFIVFCGVDFMAETAAVLAARQQMIFTPDPGATCVMADMAPAFLVQRIIEKISLSGKVIPLSYVNSSLGVKAVCGEYGGSVCTSSNASTMLDWAFRRGDRVLFLPDKNLGRNTAHLSGVDPDDIHILDIRQNGANIRTHELEDKKFLLWPGVCAVHFRLKKGNVMSIRNNNPGALIVVHPESHPQVVSLADEAGSTSKIISFTRDAPPGSRVFIGTEDNLVFRLKREYPDKDILPLGAGYCSNMARITPELLARCLENLTPENAVRVDPGLAQNAYRAVETMLEVSSQ
jgi:quinolinate synthase